MTGRVSAPGFSRWVYGAGAWLSFGLSFPPPPRCGCALNPGFLHAAVSSPVLCFGVAELQRVSALRAYFQLPGSLIFTLLASSSGCSLGHDYGMGMRAGSSLHERVEPVAGGEMQMMTGREGEGEGLNPTILKLKLKAPNREGVSQLSTCLGMAGGGRTCFLYSVNVLSALLLQPLYVINCFGLVGWLVVGGWLAEPWRHYMPNRGAAPCAMLT